MLIPAQVTPLLAKGSAQLCRSSSPLRGSGVALMCVSPLPPGAGCPTPRSFVFSGLGLAQGVFLGAAEEAVPPATATGP